MITALLITGMVMSYLVTLSLGLMIGEWFIRGWLDDYWPLEGRGYWFVAFIIFFLIGTYCIDDNSTFDYRNGLGLCFSGGWCGVRRL